MLSLTKFRPITEISMALYCQAILFEIEVTCVLKSPSRRSFFKLEGVTGEVPGRALINVSSVGEKVIVKKRGQL